MSVSDAIRRAEQVVNEFNPNGLVPFPFRLIEEKYGDVSIFVAELPPEVSGAIRFRSEESKFEIFINASKPETRQYFTIAHEIGHYFLHGDLIKKEDVVVDDDLLFDGNKALYRMDDAEHSAIETEANNFAAALIMPEPLVRRAWETLKSVEECASLFKVSVVAMSIRLEKFRLLQ